MRVASEGQYRRPHVLAASQKPNEGLHLFPDKSPLRHSAPPRYVHKTDGTRLTYQLVIPCAKNIYCAFPIFDLAPRFGMMRLFIRLRVPKG